jgi:DNA polymerase-4
MQLPASIGVAPNSLVAKIASSRSKPDGALIVSKDKILDFLWPLDVASIPGVGPKTIKTLNFMGIKKIKDLAEADLYFLERNLGSFAYFLNKVANDGNFSYPCQVQSDKSISNEYTFKVDTSDIEAIKAKLMQLSRKISFRLRHKNIKANKLCLKVRFSNFKTKTKVFTFKRATNHFNTIYYQAKEGYQQWIKQGVRIRLLGIKVYRFISDDYQDFIFEDTEQERYEKLHNALKNIADKYGFGRVFLGVEKFKIKGKK